MLFCAASAAEYIAFASVCFGLVKNLTKKFDDASAGLQNGYTTNCTPVKMPHLVFATSDELHLRQIVPFPLVSQEFVQMRFTLFNLQNE